MAIARVKFVTAPLVDPYIPNALIGWFALSEEKLMIEPPPLAFRYGNAA